MNKPGSRYSTSLPADRVLRASGHTGSPARVRSTDAGLNRRLAIAGLGVTLAFEGHVRDAIDRGELVSVLEEFCAPFPGYYLYYPQRRHASRALLALIEHLRRWRQRARGG